MAPQPRPAHHGPPNPIMSPRHGLDDTSEKQAQRRPRTLSFYLVLVCAVIPVWSVVPLAWAYVAFSLCARRVLQAGWTSQALLGLALSEVLFSIYYFCMAHYITGPSPMAANSLPELQAAFARIMRYSFKVSTKEAGNDLDTTTPSYADDDTATLDPMDPRAVDFRNMMRTWFGRVPWSSIHRDNFHVWLYWSIFNETYTSIEDIPKPRRRLLEELLALLERRTGLKFPEGFNSEVKALRLTIDPVATAVRPLVWYMVVSGINWLVRWRLDSNWHAHSRTYEGLDYILRVPENWSPDSGSRPVVFLHGLGLGVLQYAHFIETIFKAEPHRPFLIPLLPHVSQEIFHPRFLKPMGRHESANVLSRLLLELGWVVEGDEEMEKVEKIKDTKSKSPTGVTMLSHSNGTFIHCWLLKAHPGMITRSCFVDPVVFCQWEGDLCYNFCYRPCSTGFELLVKYFVGLELGVAYYIQRHFCWSSNTLWYDEIPNGHDPHKAMFIVGGKDSIVNGPRVQQYLKSHGVDRGLYYDPNGQHGQALLTADKAFSEVTRWLREPNDHF